MLATQGMEVQSAQVEMLELQEMVAMAVMLVD